MTITTYHINHVMKSYFKQDRSIGQESRKVKQSINDAVKLSAAGRERIFKKMKKHALDQVIIQSKGK
jgi:hypothetical protein